MRRNGKKNVRNRAEFVYNRNGDNMNTLQEAREKINAIDAQMADLFEERMRTVEDVIQYKKEHQMQVLDPTREQAVIERNQKRIRDPRYAGVRQLKIHKSSKSGLVAAFFVSSP